jgi:hypothetical protein
MYLHGAATRPQQVEEFLEMETKHPKHGKVNFFFLDVRGLGGLDRERADGDAICVRG